jgi:hypothetical protein
MNYFIILATVTMVLFGLYFAFKSFDNRRNKYYQDYLRRKR